jgi:hypothetical protein
MLKICVAAACAVTLSLAVVGAPTVADAQAQKKVVKKAGKRTVATAPARSRITVRPRSFLDPGREIIPGSQGEFTDYAFPPAYSPTAVIDNRGPHHRSPLPGPFDLPGRNNPYPWNWCVGC